VVDAESPVTVVELTEPTEVKDENAFSIAVL